MMVSGICAYNAPMIRQVNVILGRRPEHELLLPLFVSRPPNDGPPDAVDDLRNIRPHRVQTATATFKPSLVA